MAPFHIEVIERRISTLCESLRSHPLYHTLASMEDIRTFMESHVFAVWDFMSLLKSLQTQLTCTRIPWLPSPHPELTRFINEIVLDEESDLNASGQPKSHFQMYLEAMEETGADTSKIGQFTDLLAQGISVEEALDTTGVNPGVRDFVSYSFSVIRSGKPHQVASAFTFGREDVIPDMFLEILSNASASEQSYEQLRFYLKRHIELDGDQHGPISLRMVAELCGNDQEKWREAEATAVQSLMKRLALWDSILATILSNRR